MLGATQPFTATVSNASNTAVTWSVNGVLGGNSTLGTISASGLYTAPQNLPPQAPIQVQATSQADPTRIAGATVAVLSDLAIAVTPVTADVELGATRQFAATVSSSGNPNRAVSWTLSGAGCSGTACGSIDISGLFAAPQILPPLPSITLTAKSLADPSKAVTATINVTSNFNLAVSGPASVDTGTVAQFTATLTPAPNSNPDPAVSWGVSGPGCSGTACGSISSAGASAASYTAPAVAPLPNTVSITATPVADPTKAASITVAIRSVVLVTISPTSASVELGFSQPFTATVTGAQAPTVTWDVNGIVGGNQTVGTVTSSAGNPNSATYIAPLAMPAPNQVTVRARSNADPSVSASAVVTLFSSIVVQIAPSSSTRAVNHRQAFIVQVTQTPNQNVEWQVDGIPGGNTTVGQICVANVNPCQPISTTSGGSVDYLAPASVPPRNPVTVSAISQADPSKSGQAQVTILAYVLVGVSPSSVTLAPGTTQQFAATVLGTPNQNVTWQVSGAGCTGAGSPCGNIDATGLYTAPLATPSPNTLNVTATSVDDTTRSGSATVTIATGATITSLMPASAFAGSAGGFTLKVLGSNFVASSPGPGSTIVLNGSPRTTTCASSNECTTTLAAADLAAPSSLPVQITNPGATTSNQVSFVILPSPTSEDIIPLAPGTPSVAGKDITAVEPSTAGASTPQNDVDLNLVAIGRFSPASSTCVLAGNPVVLARPSSGTATVDICAFSPSGLDPAMTYTISGPTPNDVSIVGKQPLGLGIVRLTLQLASTAQPGARTLFVENANKDKTAASGALEVK